MQPSMTPFLLAIEIGFLFFLTWRAARRTAMPLAAGPVYLLLFGITVYGLVTSVLGVQGYFLRAEFLALFPAFWLQALPLVGALIFIIAVPRLRQGLRDVIDTTPLSWFAWFHALRITALGTAVKAYQGTFPVYFEIFVGIPDLLFGFSALWVAWKLGRGEFTVRGFMLWNLLGALVIVPAAPILLQLGLPGPLQVFTALPDARVAYTFPMSIAPMIGVPLFVMVNLAVAWRLWERSREKRPQPAE